MLNAWNQAFYNALTRKDLTEFFHQLAVFGVIAGGLLVLNVAQAWLNQMAKVNMAANRMRSGALLASSKTFSA